MTQSKLAGGSFMKLFEGPQTAEKPEHTDDVLLAEAGNDTPFAAWAYANLVVFTALLFSLAGLDPYAAVKYTFFAFAVLLLVAVGSTISRKRASVQSAAIFVTVGLTLNELALASILVFDFFAPVRTDGSIAIATVVSMSFLSLPLFARFLKMFLVTKLCVIGLCCLYAMTTPFHQFGISIALATLVIAYLLIAAMGFWIITRRHEEIRLRSELSRMSAEAEQARDEAEADFELRQRLLSYIGHDLRQPISAARFVLHKISTLEQQPETQTLVGDAQECIQSAGRMIEDIVQITHYNSPNIEVLPEHIQVDSILKQTVREYAAGTNPSGTLLRYVPSSVSLNIDPELLSRILRNLIGNAFKHAKAKYVVLGLRRRADGIEIWVVDNGRGLSASQSTRETTGLGIGLKISRQLAHACGAKLDLVSTPNKGTCCRLKIPSIHVI